MAGRIRIEPYRPLDVHTPAVPGGGYIRVDASAASPGKFGPSPLMKQVLEIAQGLPGFVQGVSEHLARDNEAAVKDADMRLGESEQALLFDPQDGYLNIQGEAALTKAPEVLDAYTKAQERELDALPNDEQRRMFEELAQRRLATFSEQVERHSAAERQRWYDEAGDRRIAQMRADAGLYWSNDALLRRALGTTRAEVRDQAERHGWDSPLTEVALRQQTSRTLVSAIEAAVERDPGRAQAVRTRYDQHIEASDRAALDALLSEAQTRQRAQAASAEILNATPPDGEQATPQWRLRQAEAIPDPDIRAATIRRVRSAAAADETRARALAEQVLARVLKDHLTDPSQIPVREWVALDAKHRQAIETRLDHNAAGTEPAPNPPLVDELATEMTQAPHTFARRDLVPAVAHLPLAQWQRFRDWQTGIQRNDPATDDTVYAIKRALRIACNALPMDTPSDCAANIRAKLVEEVETWRRITGKSPGDSDIEGMLERYAHTAVFVPPRTLEGDPRRWPEIHHIQNKSDKEDQSKSERDGLRPEERQSLIDMLVELFLRSLQPTPSPLPRRDPLPRSPHPAPPPPRLPSPPPAKPTPPLTTKPPSVPDSRHASPPASKAPGAPTVGTQGPQSIVRRKPSERDPRRVPIAGTEFHHPFPQQWWNPNRESHLNFSSDAQKYFDGQVIRVWKGHWDGSHFQYNSRIKAKLDKKLEDSQNVESRLIR